MRTPALLALCLLAAGCDDYILDPGEGADPNRVDTILGLTGDATAGEAVFNADCDVCHDPAGAEDRAGPALGPYVPGSDDAETITTILDGQGPMPPQNLEDQEVADVLAWLHETFDAQ